MPSLDTIRRIEIRGSTSGVNEAAAALKNLATAQGNVAVVSETTSKASLSAQASLERLRRQLESNYSSQQAYAKGEATLQKSLNQGLLTTQEYAKMHDQLSSKYTTATGLTAAFGKATSSLQLQMMSLSGGLGLTGSILSSFGTAGFAAAVGLGAVKSGIDTLSDMAHSLAEKAKGIREFSEATGLSVAQFQALRSEAGKFGIDSETLAAGISKFASSYNELRLGSGSLLTDVRKINPALADQMQRTNDTATAVTLLGKAVAGTDDIFQRNALLKAALGKGSAQYGAFFQAGLDVKALGDAAEKAGRGLDENLIKKLAQLQIDIDKANGAARSTFASIFGTSTLEGERAYAQGILEIAKYAKEFTLSKDFHKLIDYKVGANAGTALSVGAGAAAGAAIGATGGAFIGGIGALPGAAFGALAGAIAALISDKTAEEIKKIAPGSLTGAPSASTSMANFSSPASGYGNFQNPPTPQAPLTNSAQAERLSGQVSLLGAAATPAEKLRFQLAELAAQAEKTYEGTQLLARAQNGLRQSFQVDQLNAVVAAIGEALSVAELIKLAKGRLAANLPRTSGNAMPVAA
jgi:hypothetical protein